MSEVSKMTKLFSKVKAKGLYFVLIFSSLLVMVSSISSSYMHKLLFENIQNKNYDLIITALIVLTITYILTVIFGYIKNISSVNIVQKNVEHLKLALFSKVLYLPASE